MLRSISEFFSPGHAAPASSPLDISKVTDRLYGEPLWMPSVHARGICSALAPEAHSRWNVVAPPFVCHGMHTPPHHHFLRACAPQSWACRGGE